MKLAIILLTLINITLQSDKESLASDRNIAHKIVRRDPGFGGINQQGGAIPAAPGVAGPYPRAGFRPMPPQINPFMQATNLAMRTMGMMRPPMMGMMRPPMMGMMRPLMMGMSGFGRGMGGLGGGMGGLGGGMGGLGGGMGGLGGGMGGLGGGMGGIGDGLGGGMGDSLGGGMGDALGGGMGDALGGLGGALGGM